MIAVLVSLMLFVSIPSPIAAEQLPPSDEQIVEGIAAIVTIIAREPIRELIFYSDLERYRLFFAPPEEKSDLSQYLTQVIHQRLLRHEARRFILEKPTIDAVKGRLKKIRQHFENDGAFGDALHQTGLIESELEEEIREYLWVEQLLDERIKGFIFISPKVIEGYFREHPDLFAGRTLSEVNEWIETLLITKKESEKKAEYLQRIKAKTDIKILLK